MSDGDEAGSSQRPAHVDADGVVDDDYHPEDGGSEAARTGGDEVLATGDPETDDYEIVKPFSA
jgi:single-strand DNA-binding protein